MSIVLLTGFDVWGEHTVNSSWAAVQEADPALPGDWSLQKHRLPVSWKRSLATLAEAWTPEVGAVIACGMAPGDAIRVEQIAINLTATDKADGEGKVPLSEYVLPGAPPAYFSGLPTADIVNAMVKERIKAVRSANGGTFLCNYVFYAIMHRIRTEARHIPAGFVHVPPLNPDVGIDQAHVARAVEIAVETTVPRWTSARPKRGPDSCR